MADPGFLSGFIGFGISLMITKLLRHISIAVCCREELESLKSLLIGLQGVNSAMQKCREALSSGQFTYSQTLIPADVNKWFLDLHVLLGQANEKVQNCTISTNPISRYKTSKRLAKVTRKIKEHRDNAALVGITTQLLQWLHQTHFNTHISSASISSEPLVNRKMYVPERLVLGQEEPFLRLKQLMDQNTPRIGVVGKGGAGKTLLLKRLFKSVENLFPDGLLLWVTASTTPSFPALRNELCKQISFQINERPQVHSEEDAKIWLDEKLSEKKFILFLDDVWETSAPELLEELCVDPLHLADGNHNGIIIISSRSRRVFLQMGIPSFSPAIVDVQNLTENDSWKLFSCHAFPYNNGILPECIDKEVARSVCKECDGLPLAIKVIGRAMSAVCHLQGWRSTLQRLRDALPISTTGNVQQNLYGRLRLSYDNLDVSLQLCFLYLAAFPEDTVFHTDGVKYYWMGEGLATGDNANATAQSYVNVLVDRGLIEVVLKDIDGHVICFRVHDVLHDLATHIGLTEENCLFQAGKGLKEFPPFGAYFRISLMDNKLTSVPNSLRGPSIRSLILYGNRDLKGIPDEVISSMISLQVLDLSWTSLQSLPKSIGCLKDLICLCLRGVPIKRLPRSVTSLIMLQILILRKSSIRELPSSIHRLRSLRILDIDQCEELQCVPHGISKLTSLEELQIKAACSRGASINDLSALKHLKKLWLFNNGETIHHGTLGNMVDMEKICLHLTMMKSLPQDVAAMSKLRTLSLLCPDLIRVELSVCGFAQLSTLRLWNCEALKEVRDLHKLASLKILAIAGCPEIEELPMEFGERGALPKLEVLFLMDLDKLGELPQVDEEAMPLLKTLSIVGCESLKVLAEGYWNLKSVQKIEIYGCSMLLQNLQEEGNVMTRNRAVKTLTMSSTDTDAFVAKYIEKVEGGLWKFQSDQFWSNEYFQTINRI